MKKNLKNIERLSQKKQEKCLKNTHKVTHRLDALNYMHYCAENSQNLMEFYKLIEENPRCSLFTHNGNVQGLTYMGKTYLFERNISEQYKVLVWNELHRMTKGEQDNELTR